MQKINRNCKNDLKLTNKQKPFCLEAKFYMLMGVFPVSILNLIPLLKYLFFLMKHTYSLMRYQIITFNITFKYYYRYII